MFVLNCFEGGVVAYAFSHLSFASVSHLWLTPKLPSSWRLSKVGDGILESVQIVSVSLYFMLEEDHLFQWKGLHFKRIFNSSNWLCGTSTLNGVGCFRAPLGTVE